MKVGIKKLDSTGYPTVKIA